MKSKIALIIVIVVGLAGILYFSFNGVDSQATQNLSVSGIENQQVDSNANSDALDETISPDNSIISLDVLSQHNLEDDCWVEYQDKIYDLTDWLPKHPGKASAILPYCGTLEFEEAFKEKHPGKASMFVKVAELMGDFNKVGGIANEI